MFANRSASAVVAAPLPAKRENRPASEQGSEINLHFVDQSFVECLSQNLPAALNQNTRDFFSP